MEEKVYKIASKRNRKDARRHIFRTIKAVNEQDAKDQFDNIVTADGDTKNYRYILYTGDWSKEVAYFDGD